MPKRLALLLFFVSIIVSAIAHAQSTCSNSPAMLSGSTPVYFDSLQSAYNSASNSGVIKSEAVTFTENPIFSLNISTTIQGGYDCSYSTDSLYSTLNGTLTISNGTVTVSNLIIQGTTASPASFTIAASAGTGGSISPSGTTTVEGGASQTYTITSLSGYTVSSVLVDGSSVGAVSSYTFSNVTADHTISATFIASPAYSISGAVSTSGGAAISGVTMILTGTVSATTTTSGNGSYTFAGLSSGSYTITPSLSGYAFSPSSKAATISNGNLTNRNFTGTATSYTITAYAGSGGTISPSGSTTVNSGGSQTYTVAPSAGYAIVSVLIDGISLGAVSSYTFTNVTANHTISVTFTVVTASVSIASAGATPLSQGFAGYNLALVWYGVSHRDLNFRAVAATLSPGWLRFPAGTGSLSFDWTTGLMRSDWVSQFSTDNGTYQLLQGAVPTLGGKGGDLIQDFAQEAAALGANAVICVNGATDTPQSAGSLATWIKANGLTVASYELTNEPYVYPNFFSSGSDYAAKMKPYSDAIKAADPAARVAVFALDGSGTWNSTKWNAALSGFSNPYWDLLVIHHYPNVAQGTSFTDAMAQMNADLETYTGWLNTNIFAVFPSGTKLSFSEFGPGEQTSPLPGSLYGGVYAAELLMRLSTLPQVVFAGEHQLAAENGINWANDYTSYVVAAYNAGKTVDPTKYDWGFFPTAQVLGASLANAALDSAAQVLPTTLSGGSTVAATGLGTVPALHAQAYLEHSGKHILLVTNKGTSTETVGISNDGNIISGNVTTSIITGTDPTATNTAANTNLISIQQGSSTVPLQIPPYSVVQVTW